MKIAFAVKPVLCVVISLAAGAVALCQEPDVHTIIQKSVAANQRDFEAAPEFSHDERDKIGQTTKTYHITMLDGSPYSRLIAINGEPLSAAQNAQEEQKLKQETSRRNGQSPSERRQRIAKYQKDRKRDHDMLDQMTKAFNFQLLGSRKLNGFDVYYLKATPRLGYNPPNMDTEVLTGMEGRLWIDKNSFQWVKVTAQVTKPVSIEGFLAQVEPGTNFLLEKMPVGDDIWEAKHFAMHSHAKVLFLFNRSSAEEEWYFNYKRANHSAQSGQQASRP
jgi:outer membrane lipoprotein-sorting protein